MLGLMATVSGHPSSTTSGKPQKTFTKRKSEVLDYSEDEEEKTDLVGHILSSRRLSTNDKYFEMQLYCNVNKDLIPVVHAKRCYKLDY